MFPFLKKIREKGRPRCAALVAAAGTSARMGGVDKMMELPDITFCPHGRPVAMEMKKSGLDRQFKRT